MDRRLVVALFLLSTACSAGQVVAGESTSDDVTAGPAGDTVAPGADDARPRRAKLPDPPAQDETGGPLFRASADSATPSTTLNSLARYEAALQVDGTLTI